jgi:hypothetical protein
MTRVNAVFFGRFLGVPNLKPGASLRLCAAAPSVPELAKLDRAPAVAQAWAALLAATEDAGAAVLSEAARVRIGERIAAWDGSDPGLGSTWMREAASPLRENERAAAEFALTCALAAYRVDDALTAKVRKTNPTDRELVSIAAWASSRATRRIASWL